MRSVSYLVGLTMILGMGSAHSYELATHGRLTEQAYAASLLPQRLADFGLEPLDVNPFGTTYYDNSSAQTKERSVTDFANSEDRMSVPDDNRTIRGWLMRGAIREDDLTTAGCIGGNLVEGRLSWECNPQDDPYGNIIRVFNHFYDPHYNRRLTLPLTIRDQEKS